MKIFNAGMFMATTAGLVVATSAAMAQDTYEVAVIRWSPNDIYFNGVQLGQELERQRLQEEHGVEIEFRVFGANDVSEQRNALDAQLARGVDGVLLVPWRGESMRGPVAQMREDGIPVVTSNAWVPDAPQVFVAFDNEEAGMLGGQAIVSRLNELRGEDWPSQGGVIIELRCIITASFDIGRHNGYHSVLGPIADANDGLVIETREAGCDGGDPRHIPITTVDGTVPELQAIARGHITHASVQPAIGEGVMSMRLLFEMMQSGEIPETPSEASVLHEGGEELWMPIAVNPSETFDGVWYRTTAYSVPGDVSYDDPRVWSNQMHMHENGSLPDFAD